MPRYCHCPICTEPDPPEAPIVIRCIHGVDPLDDCPECKALTEALAAEGKEPRT